VSKTTLKIILALVILTFTAEAALRIFGLGDPVLLESDKSCQYLLRPSQNHYRFFVHTRINNCSMRSDDFPAEKPFGYCRLLFVGDSITYGTTRIDQDKIFTELLHRELPARLHRPVEVLNASTSAWAIGNELGFIKSHGIFHSDSVVLVLNNGDLSQRLATANDVGNVLYFERPACAICELVHHYSSPAKSDAGTSQQDDQAQEDSNLRNLDKFHDLVAASQAKMIILFVPFRRDLSIAHPVVIQPRLLKWGSSRAVPIIDATPLIYRLTKEQESIDGGVHLSVAGNRAVADAFEQSVADLALSSSYPSFASQRDAGQPISR
jgi:hypothetical protein